MSGTHIFVASGDSCPTCTALDGQRVTEGFTPHEGCLCQTVPEEDADCEYEFTQGEHSRDGSGSFDVVTGFDIEVTCQNGETIGQTIQVDGHSANNIDEWSDLVEAALEEAAQDLCSQCPPPPLVS